MCFVCEIQCYQMLAQDTGVIIESHFIFYYFAPMTKNMESITCTSIFTTNKVNREPI